jgi:thymidylate synthase
MNKADKYMYENINNILKIGYWDKNPRPHYPDGEPAHTKSVNHVVRTYDLSKGEFPICSLRPQAWKTGIREIFTIYQKPTNVISEMEEMKVTWWGEWDIGDGTIGQRYGATVKRYDLVNKLIKSIKEDPYGRRKIISLWQEKDLEETPGLAPCAFQTIWNVRNDENDVEYLDMCLIQRSGDMLMASGAGGINEIQYAAFLMMIARHCGLVPGVFTHLVVNEQLYSRHLDAADEMLRRYNELLEQDCELRKTWENSYQEDEHQYEVKNPILILNPEKTDFYEFTIDDFAMENYIPMKPQLDLEIGI